MPTAVFGPEPAPDEEVETSVTLLGGQTWVRRGPCSVEPGLELADRYVVRARLGAGGNSTVFRAWDRRLGCSVAIKVFDAACMAGPSALRGLAREVRLARAVHHPHVCPVFDLVEANGHWFMTMELAARTLHEDLAAQSERDGAPDWADRERDSRAVGAGLASIHRHNVTHGDLTPRNVLRMGDGRLAIADFGLARKAGEKTLPHGGTLSYLAPEVMLGLAPDRRSDVWQLGIVVHEILLGGRPHWRMASAGPIATRPPGFAPPAEIEALLVVAGDCLAWDPALRPSSADGVLEAAGAPR